MKNIKEYKSTSEWFHDARKEGYNFPLAMCHGLDIGQRELNLSFAEVFELFLKDQIIVKVNISYVYNLQGYKVVKN
ncbi:MAG: hypothetical protein NT094_05140 [Candidatus Staskawiczbacteria bacterium]|nr:hypothetical protein [Candidatus Staskawiczbacteria bacterium]